MTLAEFLEKKRSQLTWFGETYAAEAALDPESWPKEMNESDWEDQLEDMLDNWQD